MGVDIMDVFPFIILHEMYLRSWKKCIILCSSREEASRLSSHGCLSWLHLATTSLGVDL